MMNISQHIVAAENRFRLLLEDYFRTVWGKTILVSHGIEHHRRVWHFATELLRESQEVCSNSAGSFAEKLIIACYLHDLGMSVDTGIRHGKISRQMCKKFLEANLLDESEYAELLDAVENHDNKDYDGQTRRLDLSTLLTVADDLDAFGHFGIYRYLEIYRKRGVPKSKIPDMVMINATKRLQNFNSVYKESREVAERHNERYKILENFFKQLRWTDDVNPGGKHEISGNVRISEYLIYIMSRNIVPENICQTNILPVDDKELHCFFNALSNEALEFKC